MRRLFLLLLLALPLVAQTGPPNLVGCYVTSDTSGNIGDRSVMLYCGIDAGSTDYYSAVEYGYSDGTLDRRTNNAGAYTTATDRFQLIQDLNPADDLYFGLIVSNSDRSVWSSAPTCDDDCSGGDDATYCDENDDAVFGDAPGINHSNIICDGMGSNWKITTAALDSDPPVAPTAPTHSLDPEPPAAANTHTVAANCSDFATELAAAITAANTSGTVERVLVPVNVECPPFELQDLTQGRVQIFPNVNAELIPPYGTRVHPGHYPHMGLFVNATGDLDVPIVTCATDCHSYDIVGIRFAPADGETPSGTRANVIDISGGDDIRLDRIAIDFSTASGWNRTGILSTGASNYSLTNSDIFQDSTDESTPPPFQLYMHGSDDAQFLNNSFRGAGPIYSDTSTTATQHITFSQNDIWVPSSHNQNHANTDGVYRRADGCAKFKSCRFCAFEGNTWHGCRGDFNFNVGGIVFSGVKPQTSHILFRYNTIKDSASALQFSQDLNELGFHYPNERFLITHNLVYDIDTVWACIGPSACDSAIQNSTMGNFIQTWSPSEDMNVTRNTVHLRRAGRPGVLRLSTATQQGHVNTNNIYVTSVLGGAAGVRKLLGGAHEPNQSNASGLNAFEETMVRGEATDPLSEFANNVIISGIQSSNNPSGGYETAVLSTVNTVTWCPDTAVTHGGLAGFSGLTFVGAGGGSDCGQSMQDRLDLAFESGTWQPTATYTGNGADVDLVEPAQGKTRSVLVSVSSGSATIAFTAPSAAGCRVQLASWDTNYAATFDDEGDIEEDTGADNTSQSVAFAGLSSSTKYGYRIQCFKEKMGNFTTLP